MMIVIQIYLVNLSSLLIRTKITRLFDITIHN